MKPHLPLAHVCLRPARLGDLDRFVELLHDRKVRRYLCDDVLLSKETVAAMLDRSDALDERGLGLWAIEAETDGLVGLVGLEPVSEEIGAIESMSGAIEPVIALQPSEWGKGLAQEALKALVAYGRDKLGLARLVAAVDTPNTQSQRLVERCGFKNIGRVPGPTHELVLYEISLK